MLHVAKLSIDLQDGFADDTVANLLLNELARLQAALQAQLDQMYEAMRNLREVQDVLQGRGVNSAVLADIAAFEQSLAAPR